MARHEDDGSCARDISQRGLRLEIGDQPALGDNGDLTAIVVIGGTAHRRQVDRARPLPNLHHSRVRAENFPLLSQAETAAGIGLLDKPPRLVTPARTPIADAGGPETGMAKDAARRRLQDAAAAISGSPIGSAGLVPQNSFGTIRLRRAAVSARFLCRGSVDVCFCDCCFCACSCNRRQIGPRAETVPPYSHCRSAAYAG